ncbi:MAG TPA: ABC transporter permease [Candidatus Baltobacteraceae bacterium]|nr:ABC transporter permease [Candidatus Baltobacteraceae bacterium]
MNPWLRRLFALLLFAYPRDFRTSYALTMREHFESETPEWSGVLRTVWDVLSGATAMRAENVWRDFIYAVRMNAKAPLFTTVVVGAIALSIATNTVAFALLNAVLLKPLPYANPSQLGFVWQRMTGPNGPTTMPLSNVQVDALAQDSKIFASVTASMSPDTVATNGGATLRRLQVKANYFSTLGVRPVIGAFLTDGGSAQQAVISWSLWRTRFGGAANVLGKTLKLQGDLYTIAGVAPQGMLDPTPDSLVQTEVWTKIPRMPSSSGNQIVVFPLVRLHDGVSWQAAQADLSRIQHALNVASGPFPGVHYYTGPLDDSLFSGARSFLWMVYAAVTGVLLIACANVANLLLVRGTVREGEFATRSAVGASPRRIASQVFTETAVLATAGAAIGLVLAWAAMPWARSTIPGDFPRLQTAGIDSPVLLYVVGLIIAVTLLTGMLPAYKRRSNKTGKMSKHIGRALAVVEIAVAFALTAGFGVMLHSFVAMTSVPLGFSARNVYVANIHPNRDTIFRTQIPPISHAGVDREIVRRIRAIPGVLDATAATSVPFQNAFRMTIGLQAGWNRDRNGPPLMVGAVQVGATYFQLLHIPMLAGRGFAAADFSESTSSVAVNETFAHEYFPRGNVVGKLIRVSPGETWHVVALVGDTRASFKEEPQATVYLPFNGGFGPYFGLALRTAGPLPGLAGEVKRVISRTDAGAGAVDVSSLQDLIAQNAADTRTGMELLGVLAGVALLLALCGIYSVIAYATQRRFHEIGIRVAVGARPRNVIGLILNAALVQGALGIAAGLLLFACTARLLAVELYKTAPLDPLALGVVIVLMIVCAAAAALVPAWRAMRVQPASALRYE